MTTRDDESRSTRISDWNKILRRAAGGRQMNEPTIDHSCSYHCDRPDCIKAQRDELRDRLHRLDAQTVPVEPGFLPTMRKLAAKNLSGSEDAILIRYIDSLQSALKRSEATNRRMVELLKEPSEGMWDGLPRKMILAWDCDAKTPRKFFEFLENSGYEIPQWLLDEPEMKNLDHVPSKGTRAVILFKAMSAELIMSVLPLRPV